MHRRAFLKAAGLATAGVFFDGSRAFAGLWEKRPNLLVIMTDQQFADAMSCCIGREHIHTPNMDSPADEMTNVAERPQFRDVLLEHRDHLRRFAREHGDKTALSMLGGLS